MMEFYIYSASINGSMVINMSANPRIDFTILHNAFDIDRVEVLTPALRISQADYIMRALDHRNGLLKKFAVRSKNKYINLKTVIIGRLLASAGASPLRRVRVIDEAQTLPQDWEVKIMHDLLEGRILSAGEIDDMIEKSGLHIVSSAGDILQVMYLQERLNIYSSLVMDEPHGQMRCRTCKAGIDDAGLKCPVCGSPAESGEPLFALAYGMINAATGPIMFKEYRGASPAQSSASSKLCSFLNSEMDECLLWTIPWTEGISTAARAIKDTLYRGGRCACLSPDDGENIKIYDRLKKAFPKADCRILSPGDVSAGKDIVICSFEDIKSFYRSFDLAIISEVSGNIKKFPGHLLYSVRECLSSGGKIIYSTSTPSYTLYKRALKGGTYLVTVPAGKYGKPFPEPRVVTYKISKGGSIFIPREIIGFIIWSLRKKIPINIIVPSPGHVELIEDGLIQNGKIRRDWIQGPACRISITPLQNVDSKCTGGNVLVYFADDSSVFDEKTLLSAAGLSVRGDSDPAEVVFAGSRESDEMYNARMMLRFMNKQAWEMGYLR